MSGLLLGGGGLGRRPAREAHPRPFLTLATRRSLEPPRKYRPLADKELWHEAWCVRVRAGAGGVR